MAVQVHPFSPNVSGLSVRDVILSPVGNAPRWAFRSTIADPAGSYATFSFVAVNAAVAGDFITLNGIRFDFANAPAFGQIPTGPAATWAQAFYQAVSQHPNFSYQYEWTYDPGTLTVTGKATKLGPVYDFTLDDSGVLGGGAVVSSGVAKFSAQNQADWSVYLNVYVDDNPTSRTLVGFPGPFVAQLRRIQVLQLKFLPENLMAFDLSNLLKPYVHTPAPVFAGGLAGFRVARGMVKRYVLEYGESYTPVGESVPRSFVTGRLGEPDGTETAQFWAVNSAVPRAANPFQIEVNEYFSPYWNRGDDPNAPANTVRFLSNRPTVQRTFTDAVNYLYFYYLRQDTFAWNLALFVDVEFEDGTVLADQALQISAATQGAAWYVEASYRAVYSKLGDVETTYGSRIRRMAFRVREYLGETIRDVTVPQTFELAEDAQCDTYQRAQLMFLNPLGGFDTLRCEAYVERQLDSKREYFSRTPQWLTPEAGLLVGGGTGENQHTAGNVVNPTDLTDRAQFEGEHRIEYVVRSGTLPLDHQVWLQDLCTSNEVYVALFDEATPDVDAATLRRVTIEGSPKWAVNTFDQTFSLELTLRSGLPLATLTAA